jgi:hypothetical protein
MRSCVLSRSAGGGGEAGGKKGEMESYLRLMGNSTDLVGGKGKGLEGLRRGLRQRCDERFGDLMD